VKNYSDTFDNQKFARKVDLHRTHSLLKTGSEILADQSDIVDWAQEPFQRRLVKPPPSTILITSNIQNFSKEGRRHVYLSGDLGPGHQNAYLHIDLSSIG
jgi:hypothetical protein